jgi:hypothetical protein
VLSPGDAFVTDMRAMSAVLLPNAPATISYAAIGDDWSAAAICCGP